MTQNRQRLGYPNLSVKLYEDVKALEQNRFVELASTITMLTLRDSLYGTSEGILQFFDAKNLHTKIDGENIITVSVANSNKQDKVKTRAYACKHFSVAVDQKGDNIIAINLEPYHNVMDLKFSRSFMANATESVTEMVKSIYANAQQIVPKVEGPNIAIPKTPWVLGIVDYLQWIREIGMTVDNESFCFAYNCFDGIKLTDWTTLEKQNVIPCVVGEPKQIGEYINQIDKPVFYNFEWLSKSNPYVKVPNENATIYAYSLPTKKIERITIGNGHNSVLVNRAGAYSDMTYVNGYEEALRLQTMSQYDSYARCTTFGNFDFEPGMKLHFKDFKDQFKTSFYIDEVIHEITNNQSQTTLYVFTHGKDLRKIDIPKVKQEPLPEYTGPAGFGMEPTGISNWDIPKLIAGAESSLGPGKSAEQIKNAIESATATTFESQGVSVKSPKDFDTVLTKFGCSSVGQIKKEQWAKGDIALTKSTVSAPNEGYICVWNGSKWCADVKSDIPQGEFKSQSKSYSIFRPPSVGSSYVPGQELPWLKIARGYIGTKEVSGAGNNPAIVEMMRQVSYGSTSDSTPWCAIFISYCLKKVGLKPAASVAYSLDYANLNTNRHGIKLKGPAYGCVAVKTRGGKRNQGHVAFIVGRASNGKLLCLGGNQSNAVNIAQYSESQWDVGFYWYGGANTWSDSFYNLPTGTANANAGGEG